jgi:hypothetical protein
MKVKVESLVLSRFGRIPQSWLGVAGGLGTDASCG